MTTPSSIRTGIIGISGYTGFETLRLLLGHPGVTVTYVGARSTSGPLAAIWPQLANTTQLVCQTYDLADVVKHCDLVFLAVPHTTAMAVTPALLRHKVKVIDLSGDYRLSSGAVYRKWYGTAHKDARRLGKAVYGLPEIFRNKIRGAQHVANPGCYPTAALLALAPLVSIHGKTIESIIIDAKSGVSGAGKKVNDTLMFCEVNENFRAYKVLKHQHTPEIAQYVSHLAERDVPVTFTAHLLPVNRGIQETIYVRLNRNLTAAKLQQLYNKFYKTEPFVRVLPPGGQPELKNVVHTNFCDIGVNVDEEQRLAVITVTIDNLVKGAAGQAVQNMNVMYGFSETRGLL